MELATLLVKSCSAMSPSDKSHKDPTNHRGLLAPGISSVPLWWVSPQPQRQPRPTLTPCLAQKPDENAPQSDQSRHGCPSFDRLLSTDPPSFHHRPRSFTRVMPAGFPFQ